MNGIPDNLDNQKVGIWIHLRIIYPEITKSGENSLKKHYDVPFTSILSGLLQRTHPLQQPYHSVRQETLHTLPSV